MTLGQKIFAGFALLLAIMGIVGGMGMWFMRGAGEQAGWLANEYAPEVEIATATQDHLLETSLAARTYGLAEDPKARKDAEGGVAKLHDDADRLTKLAENAPHLKILKEEAPKLRQVVKEYEVAFQKSAGVIDQLGTVRTSLNEAAANVVARFEQFSDVNHKLLEKLIEDKADIATAKSAILSQDAIADCRNLTNRIRIATWRGQAQRDLSTIEGAMPQFEQIEKKLADLRGWNTDAAQLKTLEGIKEALDKYKQGMVNLCETTRQLQAVSKERGELSNRMSDEISTIASAGAQGIAKRSTESAADLSGAIVKMTIGLLVAAAIGLLCALGITRSIVTTINRIIEGLGSSSSQVSVASEQVAQAGQVLAAGASEQASSLEETSASLEEMSSMTRQNADNALQANSMAAEACKAAEKGRDAMSRMSEAIGKIKTSSDETAKILKTIDEIAFQTNLLALNAAVEAARAGDAGKGFAVVAEEVRNLAQRSAEAAKSTARLIEDSQKNADNGVSVSTEVGETLQQIAGSVGKLQQLNGEVSSASQEQSKGIEQVNLAISQMDKVTQTNAASAEESASASEELSGQAQELQSLVEQLQRMVGGATSGPIAYRTRAQPASAKMARAEVARAIAPAKASLASAASTRSKPKSAATSAAEKVIPLSSDELSDF